ncbi:MAG: chromate transporter [Rubrivivax sp.]
MTPAPADWLGLLLHFMGLSLLAVGGGFSVVPGMHRYLVDQQGWLSPAQFASSIAIAQAAPGPNVMFVAVMGWQVGLNVGGSLLWAGVGALLCLLGMILPSSLLTLLTTRWAARHQHHRAVRAFKLGMAPMVVALLASTAVLLLRPALASEAMWQAAALGVVAFVVLWRTRVHLLWVLASGAVLGAMGWV